MSAQIPIGTTPIQVQQSVASGWTLQNIGANPIYLGNDQSVSPASGYVVLPGVALPIEAGIILYAVTASGLPSVVAIVQGVQAPTVSQVTVANGVFNVAGNVNATITNASIPVTGNVGITSGSVSITSGTVNVGNTVSTSGLAASIYSGTQSSTASSTIGNFSGLTPYATLLININRNLNSAGASSVCNQLQINWTDVSGNVLYTDNLSCSNTGFLSAALPVRAPNATILWVAGGAGPTSIPVTILGTPEPQSRRVYHVPGSTSRALGVTGFAEGFDLSRGFYTATWNTVNGQTPQIFITSRGGACRLGFSNFDGAGAHQFQIVDLTSSQIMFRHTTAANTSDNELSYTPEGALSIQMSQPAVAVYQESVSIAWDPTS